jgi:simple sugar transport system substrate-binding protein
MKRFTKQSKILFIAVAAVVLLIAGAFAFRIFDAKSVNDEGLRYIIGISVPDLSDPWQFQMYKDIYEEAGKYENINIVFNDAALSIGKQKQDIDNLVNQKADIIIVMPVDSKAIEEKLQSVVSKNIPVIVMQRPVDCAYAAYIYSDNYKIGQTAGQYAKKLLGAKGGAVLEIQGDPYSYETLQRKAGFNDAIKNSTIKKEYVLAGYWSRDTAYARLFADDIYGKTPAVDLVFAHNDTMGIGAYMAAKVKGLNIKIIGVDSLPGRNLGMEAIQKGMLTASVAYPTGGKQAIASALKILNHEEVQKNQEIPVSIVTK